MELSDMSKGIDFDKMRRSAAVLTCAHDKYRAWYMSSNPWVRGDMLSMRAFADRYETDAAFRRKHAPTSDEVDAFMAEIDAFEKRMGFGKWCKK